MRVAIIGPDNGAGLEIDKEIIAGLLQENNVEFAAFESSQHHKCLANNADLNIFLELFDDRFYQGRGKKVLIPNPEWFLRQQLPLLSGFDEIWCKSEHAVKIFSQYHSKIKYIGFTSKDLRKQVFNMYPPPKPRDWSVAVHVAGKSSNKGTAELINAWKNNPDLPELWLIRNPVTHTAPAAISSVRDLLLKLDDQQLLRVQAHAGIHLCPSNSEAFGHTIWEALSLGALVITTDASPMNEFIPNRFGFRIPAMKVRNINLGEFFYTKPAAIAQTVRNVLLLSVEEKVEISNRARGWWEKNDTQFRERFMEAINTCR